MKKTLTIVLVLVASTLFCGCFEKRMQLYTFSYYGSTLSIYEEENTRSFDDSEAIRSIIASQEIQVRSQTEVLNEFREMIPFLFPDSLSTKNEQNTEIKMSAKKIKNVNIQNVINEQMKGLDHARSQLLAIIGAYNTNVAEHNSVYKNKIPFLALDFSSSNKKFFVLQKT